MEIINGLEQAIEKCFKQVFCEPVVRVSPEQISRAFPHGLMYKTLVLAFGAMYGECIQSIADMASSWVVRFHAR